MREPHRPYWITDLKRLLYLAFPVAVVNLTLTAMQFTDAWLVSSLGTEALAALTPPGLVIFFMQSLGYGLLSCVTAFVSQARGRGLDEQCGNMAWQGIYLGLIASVPMIWAGFHAEHLFRLMGNESPAVMQMQVAYTDITVFSLPPNLVAVALASYFVGVRRQWIIVLSTLVGFVLNVPLSYLLIHGYEPLLVPAYGVVGAGLATVLSTIVQAVIVWVWFVAPPHARRFGTRKWAPNWSVLPKMVRIGVPASLQALVDAVSWGVVVAWLVACFGTAHQAVATVLIRCMQLGFMPAEGIATASLTMVGDAMGARDVPLAERRTKLALWVTGSYMGALGLALLIYRAEIFRAFSNDPEVIAIGSAAMILVAAAQIFDAVGLVYVHVLQAVGDNVWPMVANIAAAMALAGGGVLLLELWPASGSIGVWSLVGLYIVVLAVAFHSRWAGGAWKSGGDLLAA